MSSKGNKGPVKAFKGCAQFRQRIAYSLLSGRPIRIEQIRDKDENPGLRDFEATFLRLVDKLTNGNRIEINETGTILKFSPGFIVGGSVKHDCGTSRALGWFIEGLLPILPFGKKSVFLELDGITNDNTDFSVDVLKTVHLPLMTQFGLAENLTLNVVRRGCAPGGGGSVVVTCGVVRELKPVNIIEEGFVKKIRGVAYTCKVSPQVSNRMLESARSVLNNFIPDVYIYTDAMKGAEGGNSPGFGISLLATSTAGCLYSMERSTGNAKGTAAYMLSQEEGKTAPPLPEDLGREAACLLLDEIARGGCIDTQAQSLVFTLMALCPQDISRVRIGQLGPAGIATLQLLKEMFGIVFRLKAEAQKIPPTPAKKQAKKVEPDEGSDFDSDADSVEGDRKKRKAKKKEEEISPDEVPLTVEATGGYSGQTILVSCMGIGYKNLAKKVT